MGFLDYFTARGVKGIAEAGSSGIEVPTTEKVTAPTINISHATDPANPGDTVRADGSSPQSKRVSRASMTPSQYSSNFIEDIKHEVMVNYLHQQQLTRMWMRDMSGENEGVLIRKTKGVYVAFPPQLRQSDLANAVAALNLQVCSTLADINAQ